MVKIVVLLKTHVWNQSVQEFAVKVLLETSGANVDFFILVHDEKGLIQETINKQAENLPQLQDRTIYFTEKDIRSIYDSGFYGMRYSNHWILMWFFRRNNTYDYYWSVEYDVRINGPSEQIWTHDSDADFLYAIGGYHRPNHKLINHYSGSKIPVEKRLFGYIQIARYSRKALVFLDQEYTVGENGQDELITYSLIFNSNLSKSCTFLKGLVAGVWTWVESYSKINKYHYNRIHNIFPNKLCIFHPIK